MKKHIFFWILLFSLSSCVSFFEKELDLITDEEYKLVVVSILDPNDDLMVYVSRTYSFEESRTSKDAKIVKDARVRIGNTLGDEIILTFSEDFDAYVDSSGQFEIEPGMMYYLQVTKLGYPVANAYCTVPEIAPDSTELSYVFAKDEYGEEVIQIKKENKVELPYSLTLFTIEFEEESDGSFSVWRKLREQILPNSVLKLDQVEFRPFHLDIFTLIVVAYTDEAYYKYHASISNQNQAYQSPFAEPTNLYTNIEGGYGVFCAINGTSLL